MSQRNYLAEAFQAILRGDYAERDRLCDLAEAQIRIEARDRALAKVLAVDFFVRANGTVILSRDVLREAL